MSVWGLNVEQESLAQLCLFSLHQYHDGETFCNSRWLRLLDAALRQHYLLTIGPHMGR